MDLGKCIDDGLDWSNLPSKLKKELNDDPRMYNQQIVLHSLRNQVRYDGSIVRSVVKRERQYYEKLIEFSRSNYLLYPYHLQDKLVPGLGVTAFSYYQAMLANLIRHEGSYDSLPNFTATDCLRLLGIGRNQYIDLINTYKSFSSAIGFGDNDFDALLNAILPEKVVESIAMEPWYRVRIGCVRLDDILNSTLEEKMLIDKLIDSEQTPRTDANPSPGIYIKDGDASLIKHLYRKGLIYIEVPVSKDDRISVPTLEGFVMNRVNGDTRENLLYKIFVTADEKTPIGELANCLQVSSDLVEQAASVFCRLGLANKCIDSDESASQEPTNVDKNASNAENLTDSSVLPFSDSALSNLNVPAGNQRKKLALIFDSTITAYLMMGNLSAGLKPHAVTMFEVGKLSENSLNAFLTELDKLSQSVEGETRLYHEHALNLRETIHFLKSQASIEENDFHDIDLIRGGSLLSLECDTRARILTKNYDLIVSLIPSTYEDQQASSAEWPTHLGPPIPEANSPWFTVYATFIASDTTLGDHPPSKFISVLPVMLLTCGARMTCLPSEFLNCSRFWVTSWGHDAVTVDASNILPILNDSLLSSPMLVQGIEVYESDDKYVNRYIPLPLSKDLFDSENTPYLPTFLLNLKKHLDLTCMIGYITVLAPWNSKQASVPDPLIDLPQSQTADPSDSPPIHSTSLLLSTDDSECISEAVVLTETDLIWLGKQNKPVVFVTINLGLPIFNASLNRLVSNQITNAKLLSPELRAQVNQTNQHLIDQLQDFIYKTCCAVWPRQRTQSFATQTTGFSGQLPGPWPLPTHSFLCSHSGRRVLIS